MKTVYPLWAEDALKIVHEALYYAAKGSDGDVTGFPRLPDYFALNSQVSQDYDNALVVDTDESTAKDRKWNCKKELLSVMRNYIKDNKYVGGWRKELVQCVYDGLKGVSREKLEEKFGKKIVFLAIGAPLDPVLTEAKRIATEELESLQFQWTREANELHAKFEAEARAVEQKWQATFKRHKEEMEKKIEKANEALRTLRVKEAKQRTSEMMEAFSEGEEA